MTPFTQGQQTFAKTPTAKLLRKHQNTHSPAASTQSHAPRKSIIFARRRQKATLHCFSRLNTVSFLPGVNGGLKQTQCGRVQRGGDGDGPSSCPPTFTTSLLYMFTTTVPSSRLKILSRWSSERGGEGTVEEGRRDTAGRGRRRRMMMRMRRRCLGRMM